jgi:alkyl hydroperoxide reductase subunit AhpC
MLSVVTSSMKGGAHMAVQVNSPAPAFELSGVVGKEYRKVKLSDYEGKWVVLFFYPLNFTPI